MDTDTRRAINDLANNFNNELNRMADGYQKAMEQTIAVLQRMLEEQQQMKAEIENQGAAIKFMDEAFANIATRLDAIEGIMEATR